MAKQNASAAVDTTKLYGVLCYLGVFMLVPIFDEAFRASEYGTFHLNQGLALLMVGFVGGFIFWIPLYGWVAAFAYVITWTVGVIRAANKEMKPLPIIGGIKIMN